MLDQTKHVATHERLAQKGAYSTAEEHIPPHQRRYRDRERILSRAWSVGSNTAKLVAAVLERRTHPEQTTVPFKEFRGYGNERLEAACRLALSLGARAYNYPSLASILKHGRDQLREQTSTPPPIVHANLRGGTYYA